MITIQGKSNEIQQTLDILYEHQLGDRALWHLFADQFDGNVDTDDSGWRGEYWGKVMRGAVMICEITGNQTLYDVLRESVEYLLTKQEKNGRFSSYRQDNEFYGWDIWCRKYVAVGLEYFLRICRDKKLHDRVLSALCAHLDYIMAHIGPGKQGIVDTDAKDRWGGMQSGSILKSFVVLYELTGKKKYLDYAEYIISQGGSEGFDIFKAAKNNIMPCEYPFKKAYEMISCFEGLLEYAKVTKCESALQICRQFAQKIIDSELTIVGGCGCYDELFNNSKIMQTVPTRMRKQETCVTVSIMIYFQQLYEVTHCKEYQDIIEIMFRNLYLGALNTDEWQDVNSLPFDSYSPLIGQKRALLVGGKKDIAQGRYYGCCAAIGAAGIGVFLSSIAEVQDNEVAINQYINGTVTISNEKVSGTLTFDTQYPKDNSIKLRLALRGEDKIKLRFRIPSNCFGFTVQKNGITECVAYSDGYAEIADYWQPNDELTIQFDMSYQIVTETNVLTQDRYFYVRRGPIIFAVELKDDKAIPVFNPIFIESKDGEKFLSDTDGNLHALLEYAVAGKHWNDNIYVSCWYKCR